MLTLTLVRHAKSMHEAYVKSDIERHLAPRGYEDAALSTYWIKKNGLFPDLLVSSPAIRAYSTALIFANSIGYPTDAIKLNSSIYEANTKQLIYVINEFDDRFKSIIMFGHNPGFTDLINTLVEPIISNFPTSGVAILKFKKLSWATIDQGSAKLEAIYSSNKDFE